MYIGKDSEYIHVSIFRLRAHIDSHEDLIKLCGWKDL